MKIAIIIPTLNERGSLPLLFAELQIIIPKIQSQGYELEFVIVDDNSTDNTQKYVEECAKNNLLPLKLIKRQEKGLATAVLRGFAETNAEILCVMDADLSHPPELLVKMAENIKNYDLVLPCRNMPGGGAEEWPFHRKLTSMIATDLVKFINIKARDPLSGFFMLKRSIIDGIDLSPIGYKILLEILVKGKYKNFIEIPYIFRNRAVGTSKMSGRIIGQYLKHLLVLKQWQKNLKQIKTLNEKQELL